MARLRIVLLLAMTWVLASCQEKPEDEWLPLHWILHSKNATTQRLRFQALAPGMPWSPTYITFRHLRLAPGIGIVEHSSTLRRLPRNLSIHWTFSEKAHWRIDDLNPYELIPPLVIRRSRNTRFDVSPLLIRLTFLPEGRLRFSWHECSDKQCSERSSPEMMFTKSYDLQGVPDEEPPPGNGLY